MLSEDKNTPTASPADAHHTCVDTSAIAPLPDHRNVNTAWWQELWRRHAHITTPLRQRGLECDIEFGLSTYLVHVSLPDGSYLIVSPPQEPPSNRPPGDPEGWTVTRQHHDGHEPYELIYDSTPSVDPSAPKRPEARHGGSASHLIEAIDQRLAPLGLLQAPPSSAGSPRVPAAPQPHAPEPLDLFDVAQDSTLHDSDISTASENAAPQTAGPSVGPAASTDRTTMYVYGDTLLALTDRLNATESHADAAALLHQILDPTSGLLERLGEFFEAAGEKAKQTEQDDGFDLRYDLEDAAAALRGLGEDLHTAVDRMRALAPARQSASAGLPASPSPGLPPAKTPRPGRTR
ncbi:hypothetical protein [Streptomyces sp. NPDC059894]|uniref:hypothetical protein n=1 Tax=unclassified Streptomyces TaxID=2593676 RepID=UPI0036549B0F